MYIIPKEMVYYYAASLREYPQGQALGDGSHGGVPMKDLKIEWTSKTGGRMLEGYNS